MIKLDENLLVELGLGALPKDEKTAFLKHMYETLEMRVGTRLAERMSDAQMAEFEQFINSNDEQGAFQWLESNFPNYKDVVAEEFDKLKAEIQPVAPQIIAASQAQAAQNSQQLSQDNGQQQQQQQPQGYPQQPAPQQQPQQFQPPASYDSQNPTNPAMPAYGPQPQQPQMPPQSQPQQPQQPPYGQPGQQQAPQYGQPPASPPYGDQQQR
jgi:hypothetical protein